MRSRTDHSSQYDPTPDLPAYSAYLLASTLVIMTVTALMCGKKTVPAASRVASGSKSNTSRVSSSMISGKSSGSSSRATTSGQNSNDFEGPFAAYEKWKFKNKDKIIAKNTDDFKDYERIDFSKVMAEEAAEKKPSQKSLRGKNKTKVEFVDRVDKVNIFCDQQTPFPVRKDRQLKNPMRRDHVTGTIRRIGGFLRNRETGELVYCNPNPKKDMCEY